MSPSDRMAEELAPGQARRIGPICRRFEADWKAGRRPRLEDFLVAADPSDRQALLRELLDTDFYYRRRQGEQFTAEEYCQRLPSDATAIDEVIAAFSVRSP